MGLLQEAINVDGTPGGLAGAFMIHFGIWLVLHSYENGFMSFVANGLRKTKVYKNEIFANFKDDPVIDLLGMKDEPALCYVWNVGCCMHHGFGGLLMLIGWYTAQPWIWRHGMLTEVAGMDALDIFVRLPWCFFFPPGPLPLSNCVKGMTPWLYLSVFHHTVGISVGMIVILYFSHLPEFQWFGAVLLGGPFFVLGPGLYLNLFGPDVYAAHVVDKFIQWAMFVSQRALWYFPATYELVKFGIAQDIPFLAKAGFIYAACAMSIFNIAICATCSESLYKQIMSNNKVPCGSTPLALAVKAKKIHMTFFTVTKAHAWAHRAKKHVHETHEKEETAKTK